MSVNALAKRLGIPTSRLNDIALERRGVTLDTAMPLARLFGGDARSWLHLLADIVMPEAECVVLFHVLMEGACIVECKGCRRRGWVPTT